MNKIQLVDSNGSFSRDIALQFSNKNNLNKLGLNFLVVAIMGPQSSGKSTLLNNMFGTDFQVMDVTSMISQTTRGIWLSRSNKDTQELVLVLDLEGSDSLERGEDDTSFEKRSALFALSFADIVLINMGFKEVGRLQQQLFLRTILQANVKLQNQKLVQYDSTSSIRKPVLLFSIRDVDPAVNDELIYSKLNEDLNKIWTSIKKPTNIDFYDIKEFFNVQICPMAHYNFHQDIFMRQVQDLRQKLYYLSQDYVKKQPFRVPGQDLVNVAESDWELIQRDRDLDLPAQRKLQAEHKCRSIVEQCLVDLGADPQWGTLASKAQIDIVPQFRDQALQVIQQQLQSFKEQSQYYDDEIAKASFVKLQEKIKNILSPLINSQMNFIVEKQLVNLRDKVEKSAQSNPKQYADLAQDTLAESQKVLLQDCLDLAFSEQDEDHLKTKYLQNYNQKAQATIEEIKQHYIFLSQKDICNQSKKQIQRALHKLQSQMPNNFWDRVNSLYSKELKNQLKDLFERIEGFKLNTNEFDKCCESMENDLAQIIDSTFKQLSLITDQKARERFSQSFNISNGLRREWGPKDNIDVLAKQAIKDAIQVVSVFAASQLRRYKNGAQIMKEDQPGYENLNLIQEHVTKYGYKTFGITSMVPQTSAQSYVGAFQNALNNTHLTSTDQGNPQSSSPTSKSQGKFDNDQYEDEFLGLDQWENFEQDRVYLQPLDVRNIFQKLQDQINWDIKEARQKQEMRKSAKMPVWGWALIAVVGYNEMLYLVKSPGLLTLLVFLGYFLYSLYMRLDVDKQLERGLPGLINLGQTIAPATSEVLTNMFTQVVEGVKQLISNPPTSTYIQDPNSRQEVEMSQRQGSTQNSSSIPQQENLNSQNGQDYQDTATKRLSQDYALQS